MSRKLPVDDFRWEVEVLIQQALAEPLKYWRNLTRLGAVAFLWEIFTYPRNPQIDS